VNVGDHPIHGVSYCSRSVQSGQRIEILGGGMALALTPFPAEFGGLVGVGMKETQAPRRRRRAAGLPRFCLILATTLLSRGPHSGLHLRTIGSNSWLGISRVSNDVHPCFGVLPAPLMNGK
jgi:hypothetical protein